MKTKKMKKFSALLALLALLFALCACGIAGSDSTAPSTLSPESEETTPIDQQSPTDTALQLQFQDREPDAVPMAEDALQRLHWRLATDAEGWYEVILKMEFTDPKAMDCYFLFCNGIPNAPTPELTGDEIAFLSEIHDNPTRYDVDYISREKVAEVFCSYFNLTPDEAAEMDMSDLIYMESTDNYYSLQNSANSAYPVFLEGYVLDEYTTAVYYCYSFQYDDVYRAVFWYDRELSGEPYKVLEVTKVEP